MDCITVPARRGQRPSASSDATGTSRATIIVIVTPTFNSERFLDDTILSVVSQSGDFHLRYHIQDGGSSDATMTIVRRWARLLRSGHFPILCAGLAFSYDSRPDTGMYQAINRGVAQVRPDRAFLMGWINSDDRLAPGALAAVRGIYEHFPEVSFTCARVSMIDQQGVITGVNLPIVHDRQTLGDGAHDGRRHSFVMQEGTFWRSALWDAVGGLDERFRLAGDWDLWRRFARHAALFTIDSVLGFHRRHDQQLSADLATYHAEVDAAEQRLGRSNVRGAIGAGETLKFNLDSKRWERKKSRGRYLAEPLVHHHRESAVTTCRVELTSGARFPEGPYPEANLPGGMRWIDDTHAEAVVTVPYPGRWRMHLRLRNWRPDLRLRVMRGSTVCLDVMPGAGEDDGDTLLIAALWLEGGRNRVRIDSEGQFDGAAGWLFILLEWYVLAPAPSDQACLAGPDRDANRGETAADWPAIAVVMCSGPDGPGLDLRLDALLEQGYPDLDICVVDDCSSDVNRQILAAYAPVIDHVVADADRQSAIGRAIDRSSAAVIAVLDDTAIPAPGALFALAGAFRRDPRCDLVAGITVDEAGAMPVARRLPLLADGRLSVGDLLRTGLQANASPVFDRASLFFTRRIWQAAEGRLQGATPARAALDFWLGCAAVGATLRTLPVDLVRRTVDVSCRADQRRCAWGDVRRHAAALAEAGDPALGRAASATTRPLLKIVMLDADGVGDRPSAGCRRLAAALAAANQRVVCLVDDDADPESEGPSAGAATVLRAIAVERPDLVVLVGDRLGERGRDVADQLIAANRPTINVRHRRASAADGEASRDPDPTVRGQGAARSDVPLPGTWATAPSYGVLVYGPPDGRVDSADASGDRGPTVHCLRAGVDTAVYQPNRRPQARRVLGLPADAFIVLAVSDHPTVLSSSLAATIDAYGMLDCDDKLLIVLGYRGELPPIHGPIRRADDERADDMHALLYAAADAVVSLLGEAAEMPLAQAAASGTPAIVAHGTGRAEVISDGPFGLRLSAWTPPLLAQGLRRLHRDRTERRRLARSGVAHVRANHSLAAGAWSFMTLVGSLPGFQGLSLAPELRFPATPPPVALRPLRTARARPHLQPVWWAAPSPPSLRDTAATATDGIRLALSAEAATVYLRARHAGPQRIKVRAASREGRFTVAVGVNGDDRARLEFVARASGFDAHDVRAELFRGPNRIDFALASASGASPACLMLASLNLEDDVELIEAAPPGRRWQPLIGFAKVDQVDGNGAPNHWIDSPSATLRLWSDVAGPRQLCLSLKNYGEPQAVEIAVDGVVVGVIDTPTTDFINPAKLVLETTAERGWNLVSLTVCGLYDTGQFSDYFAIVLDDAYFAPEDESHLQG